MEAANVTHVRLTSLQLMEVTAVLLPKPRSPSPVDCVLMLQVTLEKSHIQADTSTVQYFPTGVMLFIVFGDVYTPAPPDKQDSVMLVNYIGHPQRFFSC